MSFRIFWLFFIVTISVRLVCSSFLRCLPLDALFFGFLTAGWRLSTCLVQFVETFAQRFETFGLEDFRRVSFLNGPRRLLLQRPQTFSLTILDVSRSNDLRRFSLTTSKVFPYHNLRPFSLTTLDVFAPTNSDVFLHDLILLTTLDIFQVPSILQRYSQVRPLQFTWELSFPTLTNHVYQVMISFTERLSSNVLRKRTFAIFHFRSAPSFASRRRVCFHWPYFGLGRSLSQYPWIKYAGMFDVCSYVPSVGENPYHCTRNFSPSRVRL